MAVDRIRIDQLLGKTGAGSRSQIRQMAKKGRIMLNNVVINYPSVKIDPKTDELKLDGVRVAYSEYEYIMLYKPAGYISATEDRKQKTVMELIDSARSDLSIAGRLDIDTEGLLLITNDGELIHRLLSPKRHVDKVYYLETDVKIPDDAAQRMAEGIVCDEELTALPARLKVQSENSALLTIHEGKFHQVKRMMKAVGCDLTYLKRLSIGPLVLDESLGAGGSRNLTEEEIDALRHCK